MYKKESGQLLFAAAASHFPKFYFAYSVALDSRITFTLI